MLLEDVAMNVASRPLGKAEKQEALDTGLLNVLNVLNVEGKLFRLIGLRQNRHLLTVTNCD